MRPELVEFEPFPLPVEPTVEALEEALELVKKGECEGLCIVYQRKGSSPNYHWNAFPGAREKLIGGLHMMQEIISRSIASEW